MKTLVLDQGYQPHRVVPWQRALRLICGEKVEVVEVYQEQIRSPSLAIPMPSVVRLQRPLPRMARVIKFSKHNVLHRDSFRCQYCGTRPSTRELTFDHVVPRSRGGGTCWENIVVACRTCNGRKGGRTPAEAGMKLSRAPAQPAWLPAAYGISGDGPVPESWIPWVQILAATGS
jgi:5-methylcytosine-specific restriction endonuclease McrA